MRRGNLLSSTLQPLRSTIRRTGNARLLIGLIVGLGAGRTAAAAVPAELAGTTWDWVRFASPTEDLSITEPESYTLSFDATGWIRLRADCNHGAGGVGFPGPGRIQINALGLTHKMCPHGTLSARFSSNVTHAVHWYLREGNLCLELPADAGTLWLGRRS